MSVRWGFLGAGAVAARFLAPAVRAAGNAELHAVAARDSQRARRLRPTGPVHTSYDDLLADPDVDAVYIALNNDAHLPWTIRALEAGKHVLCEKPLALSAVDVDAMAATTQRTGRLLVEAMFYRWHPRIRRTEQLIAEGVIGAIRQVDARFTFGAVPPGSYRNDPDRGGGVLYDVGGYVLSAALSAFGWAWPDEVRAGLVLGPTGVDVSADVELRFGTGIARLHVAMNEPDMQAFAIDGAGARLELPGRPFTDWFGPEGEIRIGDEVLSLPATDPYRVMVEAVSAAISGDKGAYVVPLVQSRQVAAVIDAAFRSARHGSVGVSAVN